MGDYVPNPTLISVAKIIAPASICFAGGLLYSITFNAASSLSIIRPRESARVYVTNWFRAETVSLPLHLTCLASTGFLAYYEPVRRAEWGVATAAVLLLVPWAVLSTKPSIKRLEQISQSSIVAEDCERTLEHERIFQWLAKMGLIGTLLHITAGFVGLKAATSG